jgi:hypothetical protein
MPRTPDLLPDWFVGGQGKRKLLGAVISGRAAGKPEPWDKRTLAKAAGVHEKHTVFRHVQILVVAQLLLPAGDGYRLNSESVLVEPLEALLNQLDQLAPLALPPSRGK